VRKKDMLFSKIDKSFKVYKKNNVYLFGASSAGIRVKKILEKCGVSIVAFIDNNPNKVGMELDGAEILSYAAACSLLKEQESYIIQITSTYEREIAKQLEQEQLTYIFYSEFNAQMKRLSECSFLEQNESLRSYIYESKWRYYYAGEEAQIREYLIARQAAGEDMNEMNIMLSAPKTGNLSIQASVRTGDVIVLNHSYVYIEDLLANYSKKLKMYFLVGVRDEIAQNLSLLYELFDGGCLNGIDAVWENDVQKVFDNYIISDEAENSCWFQYMKKRLHMNYLVQDFFEQQFEHYFGIDIYKYPFDVNRGYSIYNIGNMRIMIYQLEKMSSLESQIGKFLHLKDFSIKKSNAGIDKWYAKYYKEACKELILNYKYFSDCYSGKYMRHFYSDEDITKFKNRWKENVQEK